MTRHLLTILAFAAMLLPEALSASGIPARTPPSWQGWTVDCSNTGLCFASTFVRSQSVWVDVRVIRDWPADADPMLRITANSPLAEDGALGLTVDGDAIDSLPIDQLREIQASVAVPVGFRPIGGEGFWYPTGPATRTLLQRINHGAKLNLDIPVAPDAAEVTIDLAGLTDALAWIDSRQGRTATQSAIAAPGPDPSQDAPHADSILRPDLLPPSVHAVWESSRSCADIDPAIFASLDAVSMLLDEKSTLYLLPCGAPSAYNTPYIAILAKADGMAQQLHMARMAEKGPVTTDLIYNAKWNPARLELDGLFKGSGVGECGTWNRWAWTGSGFVLIEEASRQTCDGKETPIADWPRAWPPLTSND